MSEHDVNSPGVLIIGAGQAGVTAASALRQFGFDGSITLLGDEDALPYERPPLSKTVLLKPGGEDDIAIYAPAYYRENDITVRLGVRVSKLDVQGHRATLTDGSTVTYAKCLLATGGRARELSGHPAGRTQNLHYVRTLADARALRTQLHALAENVAHQEVPLLILGAGFLGLEVASTARQLGLTPTIVEPGIQLLARAVPPSFSDWLVQAVRVEGVALRLGVHCDVLEEGPQGVCVKLSDGTQLTATCVVAAVGQCANTALASEAGLHICAQTGGIVIDAQGRTSAPDLYAAGDCATQVQPVLGKAVRLESWHNANEQARLAAASIAGKPVDPAAPPWFWTDMFDMNVQMMGLPQPGLRYCQRGAMPMLGGAGSAGQSKFLVFGFNAQHCLRYALAVNAGAELRALRPLFTNAIACDGNNLCDSSRSLREVVRQLQA